MSARHRRRRIEPTDDWEQLVPLFEWPEQESYEEIRPGMCSSGSLWPSAPARGHVGEHALPRDVPLGEALGQPSKHTGKRILSEDPLPLKIVKLFDPYREIPEPRGRIKKAVVSLHSRGWTPKSIASYLKMHESTVYRVLKRWIAEGEGGLDDRPHGRPPASARRSTCCARSRP